MSKNDDPVLAYARRGLFSHEMQENKKAPRQTAGRFKIYSTLRRVAGNIN
jgi:hypothetical protein